MEKIGIRWGALAIAAGLWMLSSTGRADSLAEDFRVESKVFSGAEKSPKTQSTTIFYRGAAYDFLQKPSEIIVLDPARGRFILLDTNRRMRTDLTTQEVLGINDNLRQWAATQTDGFSKFCAAPKFEQRVDQQSSELVMESPWITYRVTATNAESEAIAEQYRGFSDWCARLNTRLNPGYMLALARLEVNDALRQRHQVPQSITLTMQSRKGLFPQKMVLRSEHQFVRHLVESDRDRIAQTDQFMTIFQPVSFEEYQKRDEP